MNTEDKYLHFSEEDFLWDIPFRNWVLQPSEESDLFWKDWMDAHPDRAHVVRKAMMMVRALQPREPDLPEQVITEEIEKLMQALPPHREQQVMEPQEVPVRTISSTRRWWMTAAAVAAVSLGILWVSGLLQPGTTSAEFPTYAELVMRADMPLKEWHNKSDKPLMVLLPDSSSVTLAPGASLSAAASFEGAAVREVILTGKAFFEVKRRPTQPFQVYSNGVVTKVLGTSFTVSADSESGRVRVQVRTGKVQVFEQNANLSQKEIKGVVLTANQQVEYVPGTESLAVQLVDRPLPVPVEDSLGNKIDPPTRFAYERAAVKEVLADMEKTYGISIEIEDPAILTCSFSGDISAGNLYDQLSMICIALNASYHVNGTTVLVSGKGCDQ
jgi:ferric-dicitrate binding protein FerR (iron transport regulator)